MLLSSGLQAHNGSGKTTCFTLAMLSRVDPHINQPQALCLCPTRFATSFACARLRHYWLDGSTHLLYKSLIQHCHARPCGRSNLCHNDCRELVSQNVMVLEKMGRYTSIKATSTIASASFPR